MLEARWYQEEAVEAVIRDWKSGIKSTLVDAPCGSGKSVILGMIASRIAKKYDSAKILCLTHVKELLLQNEEATKMVWPEAKTGLWSAGAKRKEEARILFAGIQSFENQVLQDSVWDIVIIDECHLIPPTSATRYQKVLKIIKEFNPKVRVVGLTATPYRMDNGYMVGEGQFFENCAYEIPIQTLIDEGSLCSVSAEGSIHEADLSKVKTRCGEFEAKTLEEAFAGISFEAIESIKDVIKSRNASLIFCTSINHAKNVKQILIDFGISCEFISGKTNKKDRGRICNDFKNGKVKCLVNVNVLTTGTNFPICDTLVLLTATKSVSKYVQIIGRVMRLYPGKDCGLVFDFGGNAARHGPIDDINIKPKLDDDGDGEAPGKYCGKVDGKWIFDMNGNPGCKQCIPASTRECKNCGYLFPPPKPKIEKIAKKAAILKKDKNKPHWIDVKSWSFYAKKSQSGNDMVVVEFFEDLSGDSGKSLLNNFGISAKTSKYKLFLIPGSFSTKSKSIYNNFVKRSGMGNAPEDCKSLVEKLKSTDCCQKILTKKDGKWWSVLDVLF